MNPTNQRLTFRRLAEDDLSLLTDWLHRPHVIQWWSSCNVAPDLESVRRKYRPRMVSTSHIKPYIAYLDTEPLGFIQSYVAVKCGEGWWEEEVDLGVLGIDQFLCDGTRLGQGLGSKMVNAFAQELFSDPSVTRVQTDPNPNNARAIRCYEKAGFQAVREVSTPAGPALLMAMMKANQLRNKTTDSRQSLTGTLSDGGL